MPVAETPEQGEKRLARLKITGKAWRERNPDYFKKYYKNVMCEPAERARLLAKRKEWQAKNKDYERIRGQRRRAKNPEANRVYQKAWARAHKDQARAYYAKNRPAKLLNAKQWAETHPEHVKKYHKEYAVNNRVHLRAMARKRHRANPEIARAAVQRFNERHPEKRKEWGRRYAQNNPVKMLESAARRRARVRKCQINPEQIEAWKIRVRAAGAPCYYCGVKVKGGNIDFDHIVPLARGGPHEISNICVSCGPCNRRKHVKLISEWQRQPQQILSL